MCTVVFLYRVISFLNGLLTSNRSWPTTQALSSSECSYGNRLIDHLITYDDRELYCFREQQEEYNEDGFKPSPPPTFRTKKVLFSAHNLKYVQCF